MSEFTLPSGRVLEIRERPTYGHITDAEDLAFETKRLNAYVQSLMQSQAGLTADEIRELSPEDGKALEAEIDSRREGAKDKAPLGKASPATSKA